MIKQLSPKWLEWGGCITGIGGALLLALNNVFSGWGFVLFLLSNFCWIGFGWLTKTHGITTMQLAYTATSSIGIYSYLIK